MTRKRYMLSDKLCIIQAVQSLARQLVDHLRCTQLVRETMHLLCCTQRKKGSYLCISKSPSFANQNCTRLRDILARPSRHICLLTLGASDRYAQTYAATALLISIGISVEFVGHPIAAYELASGTSNERLAQAMAATSLPVLFGGISSIIRSLFLQIGCCAFHRQIT